MTKEKPEIEVKLFANLRETVNQEKISIRANTVEELLSKIKKGYEDLGKEIFSDPETEELNEFLNVIVNGRKIEVLEGSKTELEKGDSVAIFPPVSGG